MPSSVCSWLELTSLDLTVLQSSLLLLTNYPGSALPCNSSLVDEAALIPAQSMGRSQALKERRKAGGQGRVSRGRTTSHCRVQHGVKSFRSICHENKVAWQQRLWESGERGIEERLLFSPIIL